MLSIVENILFNYCNQGRPSQIIRIENCLIQSRIIRNLLIHTHASKKRRAGDPSNRLNVRVRVTAYNLTNNTKGSVGSFSASHPS